MIGGWDADNNSAAGLLIRKLGERRLSILMQSNPAQTKGKCQRTLWHSECLNSQTGSAARGWQGCLCLQGGPRGQVGVQPCQEVQGQAWDGSGVRTPGSCTQHLVSFPSDTTKHSQKSFLIW